MFGINLDQLVSHAKKLCSGLILCFLSASAVSSDHEHTIDLVSFANPPYVFEEGSNKAGLINELIDKLFKKANVRYTLKLMPKKRAIIYAERTDNTCVLPIERNQEREVKFIWISPILVSVTGLFQLPEKVSDERLITLMDAKEFRIGSHLGSASGIYLNDLGFKVESVPQNSANIYKLQAGRIDFWESDPLTAKYISLQYDIALSDSQLDFFTYLRAIACNLSTPKDSIEAIRESLYEMYHDGTVDEIMSAYLR